ncbi:MAG: tryptophan synthase subunit alpha [Desulfuromonas sp.]|nr:MAG: tryptophan synthase subunit alpha [Desulfuromonas sp.]
MSRIKQTFESIRQQGGKALVPFLTAGDPDRETTVELIHTLVEAGADVIELGVPFSDPMADGPTIQAASERALAAGTTVSAVLEIVATVRKKTNVPIVLMGYYNPIFHYGPARFAADAAEAGVDGLLLVDLPPEEAGEIHDDLRRHGIDLVTLLAPTSPDERIARLAQEAEGYLYYVSMTGVTGSQKVDAAAIADAVGRVQSHSPVPVAVGFGITTSDDAAAVGAFADAVVVGSALVKIIEQYGHSDELLSRVSTFISSLKKGMSRAA